MRTHNETKTAAIKAFLSLGLAIGVLVAVFLLRFGNDAFGIIVSSYVQIGTSLLFVLVCQLLIFFDFLSIAFFRLGIEERDHQFELFSGDAPGGWQIPNELKLIVYPIILAATVAVLFTMQLPNRGGLGDGGN